MLAQLIRVSRCAGTHGIEFLAGESNPGMLRLQVDLEPGIRTLLAHDLGVLDYEISRRPAATLPLWTGAALLALPALSGWQLATLISPLFVYLLLARVSGIPLLERKADARWGEDPAYQAYKSSTPVLIPRLFR
jgi:hypothetical protein